MTEESNEKLWVKQTNLNTWHRAKNRYREGKYDTYCGARINNIHSDIEAVEHRMVRPPGFACPDCTKKE